MGWFDDDSNQAQCYQQYQNEEPREATLSHEVIAGAAAYEATKAYENHVAENGEPEDHAKAKEILAGFAGAFIDREAETKGLDWIDREEAKRQAQQQTESAYNNQYGLGGY